MDRSAANAVARRIEALGIPLAVDWYVVGGSGIGVGLVEDEGLPLDIEASLPLADLGLPAPGVEGHGSHLVFGRMGGRRVCIQTGRIHPYEGHPIAVCVAPLVAVLGDRPAGVVLTCAVGALDPDLRAGQIALISDQMNLFGPTPLVGPHFLDCSALYDAGLRTRLQAQAAGMGLGALPEVVYAHARGPQYETPAETRALRALGGDVVGMSTTYEAIAARFLAAKVAGVAVVTNAAGEDDLSHEDVKEQGRRVRGRVVALLGHLLGTAP
ncbi:MAG: purine-nucleoside phosphorylase [Deltaproteobacteria bacterium]|nr:MAG: purine-nucleoside phosphorylase [Deltaproteobacteria bacterium]